MFKINKEFLLIFGLVFIVAVIIFANLSIRNNTIDSKLENNISSNTNIEQKIPLEEIIKNNPSSFESVSSYSGRPINEVRFGVGFSSPQSVIDQKTKDLEALKSALEKDPLAINDWIAVGVIKKFFNDYEGARDAWEYVAKLFPQDPLSFENLGNLYAFYLKDNTKAEYFYKKAIENNSIEPSFYIALSEFYKIFLKDNSKAINTILSGLEKIKDVNMLVNIAALYRDTGDKTNAIKYYQEVLKISPNQSGIQEEIDRLK